MTRAVQRDPNRKKWKDMLKDGIEARCNSGAMTEKLDEESAGSCGFQHSQSHPAAETPFPIEAPLLQMLDSIQRVEASFSDLHLDHSLSPIKMGRIALDLNLAPVEEETSPESRTCKGDEPQLAPLLMLSLSLFPKS